MYFRPGSGNRSDSWMLKVGTKEGVESSLLGMFPYLIVKHEKAHEATVVLKDMRGGRFIRRLLTWERDEINKRYHAGEPVKALQRAYHVGHKAIHSSIIGPMRGNNKGYLICPLCGGRKKWSKNSICRQCEIKRRQQQAQANKKNCIGCGRVLSQQKVGECRMCWLNNAKKRRDPAAFDERLNYETVLAFRKA